LKAPMPIYLLQLFIHNVRKSVVVLRNDGLSRLLVKIKNKVKYYYYQKRLYPIWIRENEPSKKELGKQKSINFLNGPRISIIVPTFNTPKVFVIDMVESAINQTYSNWELCIADGGSQGTEPGGILRSYADRDRRIKIKFLHENMGIAENSNEAISLATGEYIAFLDHDDILAPFALFEIIKAINGNPDADFIYSDEDIISEDGKTRAYPQFKPDWSPDMLRSCNYICHLTTISKALLDHVGCFRKGFEGSQDHDLILRATEHSNKIVHIPKVLYHWRTHDSSVAMNMTEKMYALNSGKKAVADHLKRIGLNGTVENGMFPGSYKVNYHINDLPLVSIIIPNNNHADDLKKCINSIVEKSTYKNYEIVIAENNSSEVSIFELYKQLENSSYIKIIEWGKPFNYSAVTNFAVKHSIGSVLLFLNNDTEIINPDWLQELLEHALRNDIGAVGAKLYYPDDTVQHAGIILGLGGITGHGHRYFPRDSHGYAGRLKVVQNVSAVTGACLMTRRSIFEQVDGFDEEYPLAFSDIDFCLKIREKGRLIVWTPFAELYHDESKTRGYEDTLDKQMRFRKELELFRRKWKHVIDKCDPYYNVNLTREKEDFSIRI